MSNKAGSKARIAARAAAQAQDDCTLCLGDGVTKRGQLCTACEGDGVRPRNMPLTLDERDRRAAMSDDTAPQGDDAA